MGRLGLEVGNGLGRMNSDEWSGLGWNTKTYFLVQDSCVGLDLAEWEV